MLMLSCVLVIGDCLFTCATKCALRQPSVQFVHVVYTATSGTTNSTIFRSLAFATPNSQRLGLKPHMRCCFICIDVFSHAYTSVYAQSLSEGIFSIGDYSEVNFPRILICLFLPATFRTRNFQSQYFCHIYRITTNIRLITCLWFTINFVEVNQLSC